MNKNIRSILFLVFLIAILVIPYFVFASSALNKLQTVAVNGGYNPSVNETSAASILGSVVSIFFSILSMIFVILFLYAGYNWMAAAGDNAKVEKAKDTMQRAVIGLIITVGSYAIWMLISENLLYIFSS